jgi:putative transposase
MKQIKHKAYRFALDPTDVQKILLNKHCGCSRFIYNTLLKEKQDHYLNNGKTLNYNQTCSFIAEFKKEEETKWLKEVNSQSLQQAAKDLETAYGNFFKGLTKFPKFKKKGSKDSFRCPQFVEVKDDKLFIPKFKEGIQIRQHREIKGEIKSCTVSKRSSGKYYVSVLTEQEIDHLPKTNKEVGIDLGIKDFVITSDGKKFKNNRFTKKYQVELRKHQKHLSRKVKGSNRYIKQKIKVAKVHEKITNSRNDHHHKLSTKLVKDYDFISLEDLAVKNMVKNHKLAKHISDCSWSKFVNMLGYKCDWYGKKLVQVNRWYPSSKTCSSCDYIYDKLSLDIREWKCPICGEVHDRDHNAAKNIYRQGLSITNMEMEALASDSETPVREVFKKKNRSDSEAHESLAHG